MDTPKYQHDCDGCAFLGRYSEPAHRVIDAPIETDLYYCGRCDGGSVIARYGNEPSEYASSMLSLIPGGSWARDDALAEAARRQIAKWQARDGADLAWLRDEAARGPDYNPPPRG